MLIRHYAFAGILALSGAGLSACDGGGDPGTTGSTNAPAIQGDEAPTQALPTPTDGQDSAPTDGTNTGG